jgi:flagellar basal-body rod protein FlgC
MSPGSLSGAMQTARTGLEANFLRLRASAGNLANINSTRSLPGGPYRRRVVELSELPNGRGVRAEVRLDDSPSRLEYDPSHPHARPDGLVELPNVRLADELVELQRASRDAEASLRVMHVVDKMHDHTLDLLA